ncbi:bacillithiol system redox-active protein YtxJ [Pradoshia sp.]
MNKISDETEFTSLLKQDLFLFVKHSLTCPISLAAFSEYTKFTEVHPDIPTAYLAVQESRPLSNYVAELTGIKHESPQAILFHKGKAVWDTSHQQITLEQLENAVLKYSE